MININENFLTGTMYAPFCRTVSAPMEEWDRDMKTMAELGYTCLHGFAEWHDIEYEKGRFDFTKIDHFVECAYKNGLVPIINIATQNGVGFYSPRWFMEEYRGIGKGFVDSLGQTVMDGEYVVPCIDDPVYQSYAKRYLKEVAKHFAGDKRVGGYVLWGEPSLHSPRPNGTNICYCEHTQAKFRKWLEEKYGDIKLLNEQWGHEGPSDYIDFTQVHAPTGFRRQQGGYNSWEDWSEFMEQNLANHIKEADRIFKENGATQPTVTEMLPGISNGIDSWKLADGTDIIGISLFGKPTRNAAMCMNVSDSMAKAMNKSTFVIEAGGGSIKFDDPNPYAGAGFTPSVNELKTTLLMRAGYGTKGVMFWCWRPRLSDIEGNDFGMCRPDGRPLKRTRELGAFAKRMQELSPIYTNATHKADVAIFMSQQINHIMSADRMAPNYVNAVKGANYMLSDMHINSDFINEKEVLKGSLSKYKVLILPCTYVISEECANAISEFVSNGGHVIADYILGEKMPGGFCYTQIPGAGLDKVFGIEREDVLFIAHPVMERENKFGTKCGKLIEEINLLGASNIGEEYMDGYPILTENSFGKGKATYIGTQFFSGYFDCPEKYLRDTMSEIIEADNLIPYAELVEEDLKKQSPLITTAMYSKEGKVKIVTVTNTDYPTVSDTLILPEEKFISVEENKNISVSSENGKTIVKFTLGALESMAFYIDD